MMSKHVAVLLADGFEEIEALTVVDVLRRASLPVETLSLKHKQVRGAHGVTVEADALLADKPQTEWDLIVLPGGQPGSSTLRDDPRVIELIQRQVGAKRWLGAICAAPIALGKAGVLQGRQATCYPGFEQELVGAQLKEGSVVVDGTIVTSRGPGTALAFSLALVAKIVNPETAERLRAAMLA